MKKILLFSFLIVTLSNLSAKDGIQFKKENWAEILTAAKTQNKLIFLDAYTTWCGPCKMMDKMVFPDQEVGTFFNKNFINAKIDMEKGEGIELAKKYKIRAYPTLLFINGEGELVHFGIGGLDAKGLLNLGKDAMDESKQIGPWVTRFENGDRDPAFLDQLIDRALEARMPQLNDMATAYLKTQKDLLTEKNALVIYEITRREDDQYFKFMVDNQERLKELLPDWVTLSYRLSYIVYQKYNNEESVDWEIVEADLSKVVSSSEAKRYLADFKVIFYEDKYYDSNSEEHKEKLIAATVDLMDNHEATNWYSLNERAWSMFELTKDQEVLKKACKWAEQSVALERNFYNTDTLANLYNVTGEKAKAKELAMESIRLGEANGEDVSMTKKLLEQL